MVPEVRRLDLPLPTIELPPELVEWAWPRPPFATVGAGASRVEGAQPCRVETLNGTVVEGEIEAFDPPRGTLSFRSQAQGACVEVPFSRIRRVTLTTPWTLVPAVPGVPQERVRAASLEREYRAELAGGDALRGRTLGSVVQDAGWFLFEPDASGHDVLQHFVPAAACRAMTFGPSAEEIAAARWAHTPEQLRAALDAQRNARVRRLGEALTELGLVTPRELAEGLAAQQAQPDLALGELLVARGVIDANDLQTALAFKMGYPIVDLSRFPVQPEALRKLTQQAVLDLRALPILLDGDRLVVAVDTLERVPALNAMRALAGLAVAPVLVPRGRLALALSSLSRLLGTDPWADAVPVVGTSSRKAA